MKLIEQFNDVKIHNGYRISRNNNRVNLSSHKCIGLNIFFSHKNKSSFIGYSVHDIYGEEYGFDLYVVAKGVNEVSYLL